MTQTHSARAGAMARFEQMIFTLPGLFLSILMGITALFAFQLPNLRVYTDFADLLPQENEFIRLHNDIRDTFGGANIVTVSVKAPDGGIFTNEALAAIHHATQVVDELPGINHNLVNSITHRTARRITVSETGAIVATPYYNPSAAQPLSAAELEQLRIDVMADPRTYGLAVSPALDAALIKGQLAEGDLDYRAIFDKLAALKTDLRAQGFEVHVIGQPVIVGWMYTYMVEILQIFAATLAVMVGLLLVYFRRAYGVLMPVAAITVSTIWGLGWVVLLDINLDPLTLVIPFLISARALSHGVQKVERYFVELARSGDTKIAARAAFHALFRPGCLGIVADAVGIFLLILGTIPLDHKLALYASLWALSIVPAVLLLVPLMLAVVPGPEPLIRKQGSLTDRILAATGRFVSGMGAARATVLAAALLVAGSVALLPAIEIGESEPGSPLFYPSHDYNRASTAINADFPGSEELYIVARVAEKGDLKRPDVLQSIQDLQVHMMGDPAVGGTKGIPDLITQVNRLLHGNDPRWAVIPGEASYVGGLMFAYMASSPIPGALNEFVTPDERTANLVFFFKDHKGDTIRTAIGRARDWIAQNGSAVPGLSFHLAGGVIGVNAGINDAILHSNLLVVPIVLLVITLLTAAAYRSVAAGAMMLSSMVFATLLTYAWFGITGAGLNINTVPVVAVGIGIGIDYSIYIMDRIRHQYGMSGDLATAIRETIMTTGRAISFTAFTLMFGVVMWVFLSSLRFQADAALLLCLMLALNMAAAIFLVPAWTLLCRPGFILSADQAKEQADEAADHGGDATKEEAA